MLLLELISGGINLLLPLLLIGIFVYYMTKGNPKPQPPVMTHAPPPPGIVRDSAWRTYLTSFKGRGLSKEQTDLLEAILSDQTAPDAAWQQQLGIASAPLSTTQESPAQTAPAPARVRQEIDGTLLLLYFGAFLFVASAGLFVAFGGFSDGVRALFVIATMLVMYFGGFWIFDRSARLRPAGVAFVAIGMAIAPLVGIAAYHFIAGDQHAAGFWLATSVLCISMYAYALQRLRYAFISYLFIFSFLSLFESAVAIMDGSTYYYIWVLIIVGMILKFLGLIRDSPELRDPAAISAQVLIPLSLLVSLTMVGTHGSLQLSISILLAAVYYTLEAFQNQKENQQYAAAAHILYVIGIAIGVYAIFGTLIAVASGLLALAVVQAAAVLWLPGKGIVSNNFASIAFVATLPAIILAYPRGWLMVLAASELIVLGLIITLRQQRTDALAGVATTLVAMPFLVGQFAVGTHFSTSTQSVVSFLPVLVLWGLWSWLSSKHYAENWRLVAAATYILAGIAGLAPAVYRGSWLFVGISVAFALTLAVAARLGAGASWWVWPGIVAGLPVLRELGAFDTRVFSVAVLVALLFNIAIALLSRAEFNRWLVALLVLLAPVAIGAGGLGFTLNAAGYAYMYVFALVCLLFCRSIARGVYFLSVKTPISSLYRSASLSYVVGYIAAAGLAVGISLYSSRSSLHTSVILAILMVLLPYAAITVEKNKKLLAFEPWLALALLVSCVRPGVGVTESNLVILGAVVLGLFAYVAAQSYRLYLADSYAEIKQTTLVLAYAPLLLGVWYDEANIALPLALAAAGCLTLHYAWRLRQADREWSGVVIVVAFMWALSTFGIDGLQTYTHIIAAMFAVYAYWRYRLGDRAVSDQYLYAMLAVATIPLALQALGGTAGDAYGWWLLLEQVGFMLVGIYLHRRFVTMWGLYVALGAVLYQLRNLGWAALSFLALFIIGMAMYRLLKSVDRHEGPRT